MISALSYYRLGRLMQEFSARVLVSESFALHDAIDLNKRPHEIEGNVVGGVLHISSLGNTSPLDAITREAFKSAIEAIREETIKLQMHASYDVAAFMRNELDREDYQVQALATDAADLHRRLCSELKYRTCFALWGETEKLYGAKLLFGPEVASAFSSASGDVEEAGKCLALDRSTAVVFHLMRVMEVGLRALAKSLNDERLDPRRNPSWDTILSKGTVELSKPIASRAPEWRADDQFFSAAHANLRAVQFAWRNPTMHIEMNYTPDQAKDVMNCVKGFMRHLATKLHE